MDSREVIFLFDFAPDNSAEVMHVCFDLRSKRVRGFHDTDMAERLYGNDDLDIAEYVDGKGCKTPLWDKEESEE